MTKTQGNLIIVLLLVGLGAPFWVMFQPVQKWEYAYVDIIAESNSSAIAMGAEYEKMSFKTIPNIDEGLSMMGKQGWELVGIAVEHETVHPNFGENQNVVTGIQPNTRPQKMICILKRPLKR